MKKVIVTGAGGFIGKALVKELSKENIVYAVLLSENEKNFLPKNKNIIPIIGDLYKNYIEIAAQISKNEIIDLFYHLAWIGISSDAYKDIEIQKENIFMSINSALLAKQIKAKKFIFVGTNQEYLVSKTKIDGTVVNSSVYGVCKLCARNLCHVILRDTMEFNSTAFTNVFGYGDFSKRTANIFIGKLIKGESLDLIEGNNLYDWTYIDDAVQGLISVGNKGINGKQYYIGSRVLPTFKEILIKVRDILCPAARLNFGKYQDNTYTDYSKIDLDALYNDTGFECKSDFKESILKTAEWLRSIEPPKNISGGVNNTIFLSFLPLLFEKEAVL